MDLGLATKINNFEKCTVTFPLRAHSLSSYEDTENNGWSFTHYSSDLNMKIELEVSVKIASSISL